MLNRQPAHARLHAPVIAPGSGAAALDLVLEHRRGGLRPLQRALSWPVGEELQRVFALHMARAFATAAATLAASFIFLKCNFKFDESFLRVVYLKWGQSLFRS